LKKPKVSVRMVPFKPATKVEFKLATTVATGVEAEKFQIELKSRISTVPFTVITYPAVALLDAKNVWRASKYCTYHRTQSFQRAVVQLLGLGAC
jgi:hypothetical protein